MHQRPRIILFLVLVALLPSSCAWIADSPSPNTSTDQEEATPVELPGTANATPPAEAPTVVPADKEQTAPEEAEADTCETSQPGQIIGFEEFYQATLKGDNSEKRFISAAPAAPPGKSYGIAGESVEAMAMTLDETCQPWYWLKWPDSDYRGWLPASAVQIDR